MSLPPELMLRADFFREQWEIAGPGMTAWMIGVLGLEEAWPITVVPGLPAEGPQAACLGPREVFCTATLHDLDPRVPETLRLNWVIAQALIRQKSDATRSQPARPSQPEFPDAATGDSGLRAVPTPEQLAAGLAVAARAEIVGDLPGDASAALAAWKFWTGRQPKSSEPVSGVNMPDEAAVFLAIEQALRADELSRTPHPWFT